MGEIPNFITSSDWANISGLLFPFWVLLGAVLGFAGSMVLAHAVIPSLHTTRELPNPMIVRLRPPLYLSAGLFAAIAALAISLIVARIGILSEIFHFGLV